ncbi:MAG: hypothetical protein Q9157_008330, partial [Trypethelium eluteriae]
PNSIEAFKVPETEYSLDEVAKHNTKEDLWIAVKGVVLDVTNWVDEHPGGPQALFTHMGKDASEEFEMLHDDEVIPKAGEGTGGDLGVLGCWMGARLRSTEEAQDMPEIRIDGTLGEMIRPMSGASLHMASYDRDATIQALKALYQTIMIMAGDPASGLVTPPNDWNPPACTRKSAEAIDLMANLPYNSGIHLAHETSPVNYFAPNWPGMFIPFEPYGCSEANYPNEDGGGVADVTEDEIVLTMQNDSIGKILVLDSKSAETYKPPCVIDDEVEEEDRIEKMRQIYRKCGWPDNFRAAECHDALEKIPEDEDDENDEDGQDVDE